MNMYSWDFVCMIRFLSNYGFFALSTGMKLHKLQSDSGLESPLMSVGPRRGKGQRKVDLDANGVEVVHKSDTYGYGWPRQARADCLAEWRRCEST
jgi:hypothetical protein